jgi:nucleotide sugar dehydrogenase
VSGPRANGNGAGAVVVVGLGYVGVATSLSLIAAGRRVIGLDISESRLAAIRAGRIDIDPEDAARLATALDQGRLGLTTSAGELATASAVIVCVPTPLDPAGRPDLTAVKLACADVVTHAVAGQTIILASTSYVGTTTDLLTRPLRARGLRAGREVFVAFAPERVDPGNTNHAQHLVPRVVGGATRRCAAQARRLLAPIASGLHSVTSPEAAEMTKLLENSFRAVNIAFANEIADVCEGLGLDPLEVISAAATKPYGFMPFFPGPGAGGHCIPVDPRYLTWQLGHAGRSAPLLEQAMDALAARPGRMAERAADALAGAPAGMRGAKVLMVGVAYKPGLADLRGSPAIAMIEDLTARGAQVAYFDPRVPEVRTGSGQELPRETAPLAEAYDLVVVHTLHPGTNYDWLERSPRLLDCTYRLGTPGLRRAADPTPPAVLEPTLRRG